MTRSFLRWIAAACAITMMGAGCLESDVGAQHAAPLQDRSISADVFVIPELFDASWSTPVGKDVACKPFRGGVVNHHALASDLLAGFFKTLKRCEPSISHFIILSPDHFARAQASIATHGLPYRVRGAEIVTIPSSLPIALNQPELFEREHGVGALIPFLAHEFPTSTVTALAVKTSIGEHESAALSAWLKSELATPGTFLLVSSDMSHYLTADTALTNDIKTKQAFDQNDGAFFAQASDDYTDNGPSIAATMAALSPSIWQLMAQSISSKYKGSPGFTTSYLVGFWE